MAKANGSKKVDTTKAGGNGKALVTITFQAPIADVLSAQVEKDAFTLIENNVWNGGKGVKITATVPSIPAQIINLTV
jgi:hypothetical protein